ncbi:MAG: DPP IV N-terminal domain-containing protein, partial [Thermoguttaceae bacterium]
MTGFHRAIHAAILTGLLATATLGQGTLSDYQRAKNLGSLTGGKVFTAKIVPHWFAENTRFWYRNDRPGGTREFILVETETKTRRPAFDHARLAESLAKASGKSCEATHLPIDAIEWDVAENAIRFGAHGKRWKCGLDDYAIAEDTAEEVAAKEPDDKPAQSEDRRDSHRRSRPSDTSEKSPDGKWVAFTKDHNLYLRKEDGGKEFQLTTDATEEDGYEG